MINYSIVMRSVNTNLFEINQAKARIKAVETSVDLNHPDPTVTTPASDGPTDGGCEGNENIGA